MAERKAGAEKRKVERRDAQMRRKQAEQMKNNRLGLLL
jgi:hypothetical protein